MYYLLLFSISSCSFYFPFFLVSHFHVFFSNGYFGEFHPFQSNSTSHLPSLLPRRNHAIGQRDDNLILAPDISRGKQIPYKSHYHIASRYSSDRRQENKVKCEHFLIPEACHKGGSLLTEFSLLVDLAYAVLLKPTRTTNDPLISQHNFIGTTLHISDHSIHHQVHTDLKLTDKCNSQYNKCTV